MQPLPAAQGGALLSAKNRHLPFWYIYIFIYWYIRFVWWWQKKVTQKTNNTENIEENTIEKTQQKTLRAVLNNTENYSPSTNTKALTFFFDTWRVKFTNNCACVCPLHLLVIYHSCAIASIEPDICWSISVLMLALCSFSDFPIGWLSQIANPFFAWARDLKKIQGPEWYIGHLPKSTYTTWLSALTTLA